MRQLFSWRFLAAIGAIAGLALLARAVLFDDSPIEAVIDAEPIPRRIDLVEPIAAAVWSDDFRVGFDGVTSGFLDLTFDAQRVLRIAPGTPGEVRCPTIGEARTCAFLGDMLGDAVVWFSIQPLAPRETVELPPIVDLQDGQAIFENGWMLPYAPVIERDCGDQDIPTFRDFLERFGPDSVSILDLEARRITHVRCAP